MSEPGVADGDVTVVRVETERVDGVLGLDEIVQGIRDGAAARAQAVGAAAASAETRQRLERVSDLAGQLAEELAALPRLEAQD